MAPRSSEMGGRRSGCKEREKRRRWVKDRGEIGVRSGGRESAKSKTLGTMYRDFLMPLVSWILANYQEKAMVVFSLGMRWMAWSSDDDETAL